MAKVASVIVIQRIDANLARLLKTRLHLPNFSTAGPCGLVTWHHQSPSASREYFTVLFLYDVYGIWNVTYILLSCDCPSPLYAVAMRLDGCSSAQVLPIWLQRGGHLDTNVQEVDCRTIPSRSQPAERRPRSTIPFFSSLLSLTLHVHHVDFLKVVQNADVVLNFHHEIIIPHGKMISKSLLTFAVRILLWLLCSWDVIMRKPTGAGYMVLAGVQFLGSEWNKHFNDPDDVLE